jgi:predicted enzyme related to lactoylglutathione lyase
MAETKTAIANKPVWVDLASNDAAGSRDFYSKLFGWKVEVSPDPAYGGYALAKIGDKDVAGIGPAQSPGQPTAWTVYILSPDAAETAKKVEAAGGTVVSPPFDVGDQGGMAVFQDPTGAFIAVWQPGKMAGAQLLGAPNTFGWAELNARGVEKALPFYQKVFGWDTKQSDMGEGNPPYNEFLLGGQSIAGGTEMNPMVPAEVPSYWLVYFTVEDVDKGHQKAISGGAKEMLAPMDFPTGRFSIVQDPQGAAFGLLSMAPQ